MDMVLFVCLMVVYCYEIVVVIFEFIVQGVGGMWMYYLEWLKWVCKMCDWEGILLIVDEIVIGFGCIGKLFVCEYVGIIVDILCLGKVLIGGIMIFFVVIII